MKLPTVSEFGSDPKLATMKFAEPGTIVCRIDGTVEEIDVPAFKLFDLDGVYQDAESVVGCNMSDLLADGLSMEMLCTRPGGVDGVICMGDPVRTHSGREKWLMCIKEETGNGAGSQLFRCKLWDTSPCHLRQMETARERIFYSGLIQSSTTPKFVLDPNHKVLIWNRACEELTGIKANDVRGTDMHWKGFYDQKRPCLADVIIDESFNELGALFETHTRSPIIPDGWQAEGWFRNLRGEYRYLVLDAAPIRSPDGALMAVVETMEDITEHKRSEEALREKDAQLYQLQKMEAISRLAGGVAHDFNNLLTSILGYCSMIKDTMGDEHPICSDVDGIIHSAERASKLTKQMLAMGRKDMVSVHALNLNSVVVEMGRMLRRTLGEHIELVISAEPKLWTMMGDLGLMEQIIMNLAVNARDAMPDGGKLTLQTSNIRMEPGYVAGDASLSDGRYVVLTVRDNGMGIPPDVRNHIFEPFFTTKARGEGSGMGLSTVYGIVEQFNGRIEVVSQPNVGATFMTYFPAVDAAVEADPARKSLLAPAGGETILVAEDEEPLRKLLARLLRGLGYHVLVASDGVQALAIAEQYEEKIDLVLTDIVMPRMGGTELIERLRPIRRESKVLYSSGFTDGALVNHGLLEGQEEIIIKPFNRDDLARKIRSVLDG